MIEELEMVVLTHDIGAYGLKEGDIGVVVHEYANKDAFEVEFVTAEGKTVAVLTLQELDVRVMRAKEILHVREMSHVMSA